MEPRNATPRTTMGSSMSEPASTGAAGALLYKFLPAGLGAAIMICVDPPRSRADLFARAFVAFAMSYLFGDVAFEAARGIPPLAFLDPAKPAHWNAVAGAVGASGWFVAGGAAQWLRKWRRDPSKLPGGAP